MTPRTSTGWLRPALFLASLEVIFACLALSGCVMALSPADLARYENHGYPAVSKAQVHKATVTALRSLGYELVVNDEAQGSIKTSPKLVTATAHGNAYGAVATENSVGWTIDLTAMPWGTALRAEPRGYSGGQAIPPDQMDGGYMERLFGTLYGEIDSDLPHRK